MIIFLLIFSIPFFCISQSAGAMDSHLIRPTSTDNCGPETLQDAKSADMNKKHRENESGERIKPNLLKKRFGGYLTVASKELKMIKSQIPQGKPWSDVNVEFDKDGLEWGNMRTRNLNNHYGYYNIRPRRIIQLGAQESENVYKRAKKTE